MQCQIKEINKKLSILFSLYYHYFINCGIVRIYLFYILYSFYFFNGGKLLMVNFNEKLHVAVSFIKYFN